MCAAKSLCKAKPRLPPWGRCPRRGRRGQVASLTGRSRGYRPYGRVRHGSWFLFSCRPCKVKGKVAPFLKKRRPKKLYARFARPPARTCAILSMSTSGSELPKARLDSPGTGLNLRTPPLSSPRPPPRSGPGCAASVSAPPLSCRWPPRVSAPRPRGSPKAPAPRLPGRSPR